MTPQVPAWKRLGLKLKYANEKPDLVEHHTNFVKDVKFDTHERQTKTTERPTKRQRTTRPGLGQSSDLSLPIVSTELTASSSETPTVGTAFVPNDVTDGGNTLKRKKSVSFTDDTKAEDGDTRVTIDFPAGEAGSTPRPTRKSDVAEPSAADATQVVDGASDLQKSGGQDASVSSRRKKTPKTTKQKQNSSSIADKNGLALGYLSEHRSNRSAWKFNKNRDVWILKNALDVDAIPPTHATALAGYVRGLPEAAGARIRLVKDCREAMSVVDNEADYRGIDQNTFIQLLDGLDSSDGAQASHVVDKLPRHLLLLWALGENIQYSSKGAGRGSNETNGALQPKKKKKSRTITTLDISSSESESDTDDTADSDSSADGNTRDTASNQRNAGTVPNKQETSSSGSESENEETTSSIGSSSGSGTDSD